MDSAPALIGAPAATPALTLERQLAAAMAWWREAGVDLTFHDEPQAWLRAPEADNAGEAAGAPSAGRTAPASERPEPPGPAVPSRPRIGGDPAGWPQDLAGFRRWWLAEPSLALDGRAPRVAPIGETGARLMVLVPMPEAADRDALLSGPEGALVRNMLAAMGIALDEAYLAAALPAHVAQPDWAALAGNGLGEVLRHHLALAAPERLLVLGRDVLPLLGHDPAQGPAAVKQTAIQPSPAGETPPGIPTLAGFAPARLLGNARQRALLWRRWLDWTDRGT